MEPWTQPPRRPSSTGITSSQPTRSNNVPIYSPIQVKQACARKSSERRSLGRNHPEESRSHGGGHNNILYSGALLRCLVTYGTGTVQWHRQSARRLLKYTVDKPL